MPATSLTLRNTSIAGWRNFSKSIPVIDLKLI